MKSAIENFCGFISIWNICVQSQYLLKNDYEEGLFDFWSALTFQKNIELWFGLLFTTEYGQVQQLQQNVELCGQF